MLTLASSAHAWWNSDWTLRKKITLDAKAAGVPDAGGPFAVLVRLHDGDFQFGEAKDDGGDIRFVAADDKTPLTYHLEKFDPLLSEAFVWVKVDVKPGEPVSFWLYYGSAGPKAVNAGDSKGTYDSDTVLVYHFGEKGAPASDFTMGGGGAKNAGVPVEGSIIGGGVRLDGRNAIGIPNTPSLEWSAGGAVTLSLWVKPSVLTPNAAIFSRKEGANAFVVGADNGVPYVEINGQRSPAAAPLAVNSWHHLAVVSSGPKTTLYLDGETYATLNAGLPALNSPSWLGGSDPADTSAGAGFAGEIDELQISRAARSASYVKFTTVSQGGGDKAARLLSLGQDESPSSVMSWLSGGTFGVIIKSLTLDGWVVICVLAVMMVLSWFVMYNKVTYLNGISKGNALFLKEWKHVAADLTILDNADAEQYKTLGGRVDKAGQRAMRNASVYRIYHIGAEEIRHRLSVDKNVGTGGRKGLPGRSIHAIRAALDGGVVRETQKINKLIVLLTICISGGPFLGLLGTVVGVMITFAAVAAAGEVNVNAIAPGIAAALLATVAGLAVAIPSLFGYNYILSRVKDAKDDMHIFIDEFVTKMAEFYREEPFREGSD
jgi:biopolymer transport protein ExbB